MKFDRITTWDRRHFLTGLGMGASAFLTPGAFAEALQATPRQTEGPFYPDQLPLDTDNDLLIINDGITPAVGEVTHLSGTVRDLQGQPLRNALVEIWQVDGKGVYLHTAADKEGQDKNFQGYGRFSTDSKGRYYFRTIKPVPYPGRTPHIHAAVSVKGRRVLTTQLYVKGEPQNARDGIYRRMSEAERKLVTGDFQALPQKETGELAVKWDLVIGLTTPDK
ncbi:protocatechuate 3,4-dioxygenase [Roseibacillus ishigakijimensis]|uniref:Intradiol ring-cleavage dioxygenase n=1 Tax=Roseibacillus ishigakijimensis TaxID=454146 RepID=A0A934RP23_9BACT|nr:protocatechuate 3,4-dioxygenase [Roseibacillus ishigakijimensis]MBK1833202.1 intradiol ring-cleavage dioxygenase [Roseibacillus ishigakijimensis]